MACWRWRASLSQSPHDDDDDDGGEKIRLVIRRVGAIAGDVLESTDHQELVLGRDEVWLLCDNPEVSDDSRMWGPVHRTAIIGRAICSGLSHVAKSDSAAHDDKLYHVCVKKI